MSSIREAEQAVRELSGPELAEFRRWFVEFDAKVWDARLAEDVAEGRLDAAADEALADLKNGRTRSL
ncbi:MAG: hypothetical protein ABIV06_07020 [Thermoanaerobaculia bacterium]